MIGGKGSGAVNDKDKDEIIGEVQEKIYRWMFLGPLILFIVVGIIFFLSKL